ncbi:SLC13 family permease [Flammeovirgaceae bacterium SG7u.111]|nr:SLC13 family permease [Flammeovirgaceae bacterium SG7u.132]WPO37541.1 SLC13 family permease [Flammeovirgaceae bacterium SG7u.111]
MPNIEQSVLLLIVLSIIYCLYKDFVKPSVVFLAGAFILMLLGIMQPVQFLSGFGNQSIMTIMLLIFISASLKKNFNINGVFKWLFFPAQTLRSFLLMMMAFAAGVSSFINNTPMVAVMTPYVYDWGKKKGIPPSKLLIPLSYATMLGGMITVIGTSTNLVMNGFLVQSNEQPLTYDDFWILGLLVTVAGLLFILLFGNILLPSNKDSLDQFKEQSREYVAEVKLALHSSLTGKTVREARLRSLKGVYLTDIIRNGEFISPVSPREILQPQDRLIFAGDTEQLIELIKENGLVVPQPNGTNANRQINVIEVVIPFNSSLIGRVVKGTHFREKYDAAILAIHRNGERLSGKIGDVRLAVGDLLLITIGDEFNQKNSAFNDLYVISELQKFAPKNNLKTRLLFILSGLLVALSLVGIVNLFVSLFSIVFLLFLFRKFTLEDLKNALDLDLWAILVCALALGDVMIETGTADWLTGHIVDVLMPYGTEGLLIGIFVITVLLTSFITNTAAISIAFPLAYSLIHTLGIDGKAFYVAITFAASAAFMTPIGYQTNLMVYGPGGYNFKDYMRIGLPLTILYSIICLVYIMNVYQL